LIILCVQGVIVVKCYKFITEWAGLKIYPVVSFRLSTQVTIIWTLTRTYKLENLGKTRFAICPLRMPVNQLLAGSVSVYSIPLRNFYSMSYGNVSRSKSFSFSFL
jgi:hypothetical protein